MSETPIRPEQPSIAVDPPPEAATKRGRTIATRVIGVLVVGGLVFAGVRWWQDQQNFMSTNDAFVKGDIVTISAKIGGRLETLKLAVGQRVKQGDLAAELDRSDIALQVKQAEANLAASRAALGSAQTSVTLQSQTTQAQKAQAAAVVSSARRAYDAARVTQVRLASDLVRAQRVYDAGGLSRQALDLARSSLATADAQVAGAASQVANATAGAQLAETGQTQVRLREQGVVTNVAQIGQTEAALATVHQQLVNTTIRVPTTGTVARVPLNPGEMVAPGQPIASVVADGTLRVEAFLEETKIAHVKVGQPVAVAVDAFSGRTFTGHVTDIGAAAGSEFALIPANNAAGNFTKVVQRIPIRIAVDDTNHELRPGMSTAVRIDVREAK